MGRRYLVGENSTQISLTYGVDRHTIIDWLRLIGVPIRSNAEAKHLAMGNHCVLSPKVKEFIDGELLGDMNLTSNRRFSALIKYSSKYMEYIGWLSQELQKHGIEQSGRICVDRLKGKNYYHYNSRQYEELLSLYQRWYPKGKKIIPEDISLKPLVCRQWYIGDGCLHHDRRENRNGKTHIGLYTNGFSVIEVRELVQKLCKLGFKATQQLAQNTIRVSTDSTQSFLDYIGDCPVSCYDYKWKV